MAAGNHNLIVRGLRLDESHWQFSFGPCPVRSGLFSGGHFCFAAPLGLLFEPLLYCDQILFGIG